MMLNKRVPPQHNIFQITSLILDDLYCEALIILDEVRHVMEACELRKLSEDKAGDELPIIQEAMRTNNRIIVATGWILNYRSDLKKESLSDVAVTRSRLPADVPSSCPDNESLVPEQLSVVVNLTREFYKRLLRIDQSWCSESSHNSVARCLVPALGGGGLR